MGCVYKSREELFKEGWIRASTPKEIKEVLIDKIKEAKEHKEIKYILILFLLNYERHEENKKATKYLFKYFDQLKK